MTLPVRSLRRRSPQAIACGRIEGEDGALLVGQVDPAICDERTGRRPALEWLLPELGAGGAVDGMEIAIVAREVDGIADDRDLVRDGAAGLELPVQDRVAGR